MADMKCKNCEYYDKQDSEKGYCRRFPPVRIGTYVSVAESYPTSPPIVAKNDYCFEYKEKS
jgi:hypothetical protein